MPDTAEQIQVAATASLKSLKKILASRGKLQGNFYYVGHPKGEQAAIVITLTARDRKGSKALAQGKALRKIIDGARFARGVVVSTGSKLNFELVAGNASSDQMKKGFKKGFEDRELKALKALLRKARFGKPGGDEPVEVVEEGIDADLSVEEDAEVAELSVRERAELMDLIAIQGDLNERNQELSTSFLSAASAQEEIEEQIAELTDKIERMGSADPDDPALGEARRQLAELFYVGSDPFPGGGQSMNATDKALLQSSRTIAPDPEPSADVSYRKALLAWDFAKKRSHERLQALRRAVLEEEPDESAAAARLDAALDAFNKGLTDALDEALSATDGPARRAAAGRALAIARQYQAFVSNAPLVTHIDNNPYLDTGIQQRLSEALTQVVGHLG